MTVHLTSAGQNRQFLLAGYDAGHCNIGPAEVARRRRFGHAATLVTLAALVGLLLIHAPVWTRLVLFLPAAGAAAGYLQAALRFCADYGWRGVFNFGRAGHGRTTAVVDPGARQADRRRALVIGAGSAALGTVVVLLAVLVLPA